MAGAFSDYMEAQVLNWFKGTTMPAAPTNLFVGLFTAQPADTGTAGAPADGTEVTAASAYARVSVTASTFWGAVTASGTTQQITGGSTITFPQATGSWGTITGYGVWDAATAGHLLYYDAISNSQAIGNGQTPSLAGSQIVLSLD